MINILLASLTVGVGSYLLRKGSILELLFFIFKKGNYSSSVFFAILGLILNLIGVYFWQSSYKSNLSYSVAISLYICLTLIISLITGALIEKTEINLNFYLGTLLILSGVIFLSTNKPS